MKGNSDFSKQNGGQQHPFLIHKTVLKLHNLSFGDFSLGNNTKAEAEAANQRAGVDELNGSPLHERCA